MYPVIGLVIPSYFLLALSVQVLQLLALLWSILMEWQILAQLITAQGHQVTVLKPMSIGP